MQPVVKRPVWATRDYDGIHLNKTGPMDALELGVLIARRYGNHQRVEFMMRRDDGWSPRVMTDRWDDLAIEPMLRPLFTRAAESVVNYPLRLRADPTNWPRLGPVGVISLSRPSGSAFCLGTLIRA